MRHEICYEAQMSWVNPNAISTKYGADFSHESCSRCLNTICPKDRANIIGYQTVDVQGVISTPCSLKIDTICLDCWRRLLSRIRGILRPINDVAFLYTCSGRVCLSPTFIKH